MAFATVRVILAVFMRMLAVIVIGGLLPGMFMSMTIKGMFMLGPGVVGMMLGIVPTSGIRCSMGMSVLFMMGMSVLFMMVVVRIGKIAIHLEEEEP